LLDLRDTWKQAARRLEPDGVQREMKR